MLTRCQRGVAYAAALSLLAAVMLSAGAAGSSGARSLEACAFEPAPTLARMFAPHGFPQDTYAALTSTAPLQEVLTCYERANGWPAGSRRAALMGVLDVFGVAAPFDRSRAAQLYGATRPLVARIPVYRDGRIAQSVTLISPYPDPDLSRLVSGTLVIVLTIPTASATPIAGDHGG